MKKFKLYPSSINEKYIDEIAAALKRGEIILYPTDSFYAIGCDALNNRAVERVCRLRGINPAKQRLSIVCSGISQASEYAKIDNNAFRTIKANLPGPFTFILPASPKLAKAFKGRHEVGVRVPASPVACRLAEALGNPLLSASADDPETDYEQLVDIMADAGDVPGIPTAVVSLLNSAAPETLRGGPLPLQ